MWDEAAAEVAEASLARVPRARLRGPGLPARTSSQASPIRELGLLTIGSRPSRRPGGRRPATRHPGGGPAGDPVGVRVDAEPAPAAVAGTASAPRSAGSWSATAGGRDVLREMYARWPWWRAVIDTCHMTVGKADMRVARLYAAPGRRRGAARADARARSPASSTATCRGAPGGGRPGAPPRRQALPPDVHPPAQPLRRPAPRHPGPPAAPVPRGDRPRPPRRDRAPADADDLGHRRRAAEHGARRWPAAASTCAPAGWWVALGALAGAVAGLVFGRHRRRGS